MYLLKDCIFACLASAHQQSQTYFNTWNGETWETWMGQRLFQCLKWRTVEKCGQDTDFSHICNGETWANVDREKNHSQRYPIMCPIRGQPLLGRSPFFWGWVPDNLGAETAPRWPDTTRTCRPPHASSGSGTKAPPTHTGAVTSNTVSTYNTLYRYL